MNRLKERIGTRIVAVMSFGKSIEELENRIEEFRDFDICWTSFNFFPMMNEFILSKINKKLEIVLDMQSAYGDILARRNYEINHRIPRLKKFLDDGGLLLSTWMLMKSEHEENLGIKDFYESYKDRIVLLDDFIEHPDNDGPNSLSLLITTLAIGKSRRIILFGADGCLDSDHDKTFYKPELHFQNKIAAGGKDKITRDYLKNSTIRVNESFDYFFKMKLSRHSEHLPRIINCSSNSCFNLETWQKSNYDHIKDEIVYSPDKLQNVMDEKWKYWGFNMSYENHVRVDHCLNSGLEFDNVLEIGCGNGEGIKKFLVAGKKAKGIDYSRYLYENCLKGKFPNGEAILASVCDMNMFQDNEFDLVCSFDMLEDLEEYQVDKAISEIYRVCKRYFFGSISERLDARKVGHFTIKDHNWWEDKFVKAGFRPIRRQLCPITYHMHYYEK